MWLRLELHVRCTRQLLICVYSSAIFGERNSSLAYANYYLIHAKITAAAAKFTFAVNDIV